MHNPKQAATNVVLRELLGIVTKPLVERFVKQESPSSQAVKQDPPTPEARAGATSAEDGDGFDINKLLGMTPPDESAGDFIEHDSSRGRSLTDVASKSIPAERIKSPRKKRKKRGRR